MTRSILCGLFALISVGAMGVVPMACQSGGVGDPCVPEDEYNTQFPGFKVQEENIESRSFQCSTRICLVNHFQGRVSCPLGQGPVTACNDPSDTSCPNGGECVESTTLTPECTCKAGDTAGCAAACGNGLVCDPKLNICTCTSSATIANVNYFCSPLDPSCKDPLCTRVLKSYVCYDKKKGCQSGSAKESENNGKPCCVPGTDKPISVPVCGQCDSESHRNADDAVYCSCRCCPKCCDDPDRAQGEPCVADKKLCGEGCDPNFNYCKCPTGFSCSEIRKNVGLGDAQLTGAYCIKDGSTYTTDNACGNVKGYTDPLNCKGVAAANVGDGG